MRSLFRRFSVLVIVAGLWSLSSCKPHPKPAPSDSVAVIDTTDSVGTDSTLLDQTTMPDDTVGSLPEIPPDVLDSILAAPRPRAAALARGGLRYGYSDWPTTMYGQPPMNCTMLTYAPNYALKTVQALAKTGMCGFLIPARRFITTGYSTHQPFSLAHAKEAVANTVKQLPRDTVRKYVANGTIRGFNLADDYTSKEQWGGTIVTTTQILDWAKYIHTLWAWDMPLGVRVEPFWVKTNAQLDEQIDYAWAQYRKPKGATAQIYFDKQVTSAKSVNLKLVMGVNIHECGAQASPPCTASELMSFVGAAINNSYACNTVGWKYDPADWGRSDLREAHFKLSAQAQAKPDRSCKRGRLLTYDSPPPDSGSTDTIPPDTVATTPPETAATVAAETASAPGHGHRRK